MDLPKRKHPRLKDYDYSQNGAYFITICSYEKKKIFSSIIRNTDGETENILSKFGIIADDQIKCISERFSNAAVDSYVIMPNHIHLLISLSNDAAGASPRPTISDIVCAYKSFVSRECRKEDSELKVFQTSFHDHIVRNENSYQQIWNYIETNVQRWEEDCFYI
ncbi:MAG: transposase [Eubacteriales bacterium]|nr:transposase [Eubacteriales bacterium]